jgi:parallel beta-helix repeat protein
MRTQWLSRRALLCGSVASLAGAAARCRLRGDDGRPPVREPRATSFDERVEPDWEQRLTITVGPRDADIVGTNHKALQAAVDYVAGLGGGTVHVRPGRYVLRGAVHLRSRVRVLGSGPETIITKIPSHTTKLAADSDWYDQELTLTAGHGFEVGDSICLRARNVDYGHPEVLKRRLIARSGNRFKLDAPLKENFWEAGEPAVHALFPLLTGEEIEGVAIESLALDGDRSNNENLDGNYAGCVFLQDCRDIQIRRVEARNYNGDGLSWQICHDVVVEDCRSEGHAGLGLHPGSGSQRPLIRRNTLTGNSIGLFFCWGVKYGLAEDNLCDGNRVGISIGHRDTDNLIRNNRVSRSGEVGLLFRPERGASFCAHRNVIEANTFSDNGDESAATIDVQGGTESVVIRGNTLTESRAPAERIGIRLGNACRDIRLEENSISGYARDVVQLPA